MAKELDANTQAYLIEMKDSINSALDDYIEARNAANSAMERVINGLEMLGFSESQAYTYADSMCNAAFKESAIKDI